MSVSIGNQGSQYYVQVNHGGKSIQIPCENETQAKQVAQAATEAEKKIDEKEKQEQTPVNLAEGTKPEGVGQKLDLKAV